MAFSFFFEIAFRFIFIFGFTSKLNNKLLLKIHALVSLRCLKSCISYYFYFFFIFLYTHFSVTMLLCLVDLFSLLFLFANFTRQRGDTSTLYTGLNLTFWAKLVRNELTMLLKMPRKSGRWLHCHSFDDIQLVTITDWSIFFYLGKSVFLTWNLLIKNVQRIRNIISSSTQIEFHKQIKSGTHFPSFPLNPKENSKTI